jgi:hypothetical protein
MTLHEEHKKKGDLPDSLAGKPIDDVLQGGRT